VTGSAVNLPDGTVEVHAEGVLTAVDTLLADLGAGPPSARVGAVSVRWGTPAGLARFDVG